MAQQPREDWSLAVARVFDSHPRIGIDDTLWMARGEEKVFAQAMRFPGVHVCLDGPSGSGKTSLARTIFAREARITPGFRYVYVRTNHQTDWTGFKSNIIADAKSRSTREGAEVKIGISSLLPYIEFSGQVGRGRGIQRLPRTEIVERLDIPQLADLLIEEGLTLAIDDLDYSQNDLVLRVADLCKEVSDRCGEKSGKIVLIGSDDVHRRLLRTNPALRDRIDEVTLGSLPHRNTAWDFITSGLETLGIRRPDADKFISPEQLVECKDAVYDAADGLPKSIVSLGRRLAMRGAGRTRVSYADITSEAKEMVLRNFKDFRREYRRLIHLAKEDVLIKSICRWMYTKGIARVHDVSEMAEDLQRIATYDLIDGALEQLEQERFLVRTGREDNVFFVQNPLLAHTLGVAIADPHKCGIEPSYFGGVDEQLLLRFTNDKDPEHPRES